MSSRGVILDDGMFCKLDRFPFKNVFRISSAFVALLQKNVHLMESKSVTSENYLKK